MLFWTWCSRISLKKKKRKWKEFAYSNHRPTAAPNSLIYLKFLPVSGYILLIISTTLEHCSEQGLPSLELRHFSPPAALNNFSLRAPFYTVDNVIQLDVPNGDLLPQTPVSNGSDHTLLLGHFVLFQGLHHPLQAVWGFPVGWFTLIVLGTKQNKTFFTLQTHKEKNSWFTGLLWRMYIFNNNYLYHYTDELASELLKCVTI